MNEEELALLGRYMTVDAQKNADAVSLVYRYITEDAQMDEDALSLVHEYLNEYALSIPQHLLKILRRDLLSENVRPRALINEDAQSLYKKLSALKTAPDAQLNAYVHERSIVNGKEIEEDTFYILNVQDTQAGNDEFVLLIYFNSMDITVRELIGDFYTGTLTDFLQELATSPNLQFTKL